MPKPPKSHSLKIAEKIGTKFDEDWLKNLFKRYKLRGNEEDRDLFMLELSAAYENHKAAAAAFVSRKEHLLHFDRLIESPSKYIDKMNHQQRVWLRRSGWNGDAKNSLLQKYAQKAKKQIPKKQKKAGYRLFSCRLWAIWQQFGGNNKPFEGLNTSGTTTPIVGFPEFLVEIMEKAGHRPLNSEETIRSSISSLIQHRKQCKESTDNWCDANCF